MFDSFFRLQRKKTLLVEYKLLNKSNKFVDRRIGERNRNMTADDRIMARFVAQRTKAHSKVSTAFRIVQKYIPTLVPAFHASTFQEQMFNLEPMDEEILTHGGRTIAEIEKYDTVRSDSEEDEDGNLNGTIVSY